MKCIKCNGTGQVEEGAKFTGASTQCNRCGWTAIGATPTKRLQTQGGLCSDCSGNWDWLKCLG